MGGAQQDVLRTGARRDARRPRVATDLDDDRGPDGRVGAAEDGGVIGHRGPIGRYLVGHKYLVQPCAVEHHGQRVVQQAGLDREVDPAPLVHPASGPRAAVTPPPQF